MKVSEVLGSQQLDEVNLRKAAAAGLVGATLAATPYTHSAHVKPTQPHLHQVQVTAKKEENPQTLAVIKQISTYFGVDPEFVAKVVHYAKKYQKPGFPTAKDILAIIAVESEFDPDAVSSLRHDPAVGLMQVRPADWGLTPGELKNPETCIKIGAEILHKYWKQLDHNKNAAIQAYNVGLTDFLRGRGNPHYQEKFYDRFNGLHVRSSEL